MNTFRVPAFKKTGHINNTPPRERHVRSMTWKSRRNRTTGLKYHWLITTISKPAPTYHKIDFSASCKSVKCQKQKEKEKEKKRKEKSKKKKKSSSRRSPITSSWLWSIFASFGASSWTLGSRSVLKTRIRLDRSFSRSCTCSIDAVGTARGWTACLYLRACTIQTTVS